jgi:hypothetical protein
MIIIVIIIIQGDPEEKVAPISHNSNFSLVFLMAGILLLTIETSHNQFLYFSLFNCKGGASCPKPDPAQMGTCVESCSSDDDCDANLKCCSNGCGHVCTKPGKIYYTMDVRLSRQDYLGNTNATDRH